MAGHDDDGFPRGKSINEQVEKLETCVRFLGDSPQEGGKLFTDLCALLLEAMGFSQVYERKGEEQGRDIDARLGEQTWYFECKRHSPSIDTPGAAYKFLQLDMLRDELKPDYFVLISNGSMLSILKDMVEFKNADKFTKYSVEAWTNEPGELAFEKILLSYPEVFISFLGQTALAQLDCFEDLKKDFESRSKTFLANNPRFFETVVLSIAQVRKQFIFEKTGAPLYDFPVEQTLGLLPPLVKARYPAVVLIGCPLNPISGLYNFRDSNHVSSLSKALLPWGVVLEERGLNYLLFRENLMNNTVFFDYGAIACVSPCGLALEVIRPYDWLKPVREDCVRLRNFAKRGMLITPAVFRLYITNGDFSATRYNEFVFGGIERFLPERDKDKPDYDIDVLLKGPIHSESVVFSSAPETHSEIGRPLVTSLWRNSGMKTQLILAAEEVDRQLSERLRTSADVLPHSIEFDQSFGWLRETEFLDRSYAVFEGFLRDYDANQKSS